MSGCCTVIWIKKLAGQLVDNISCITPPAVSSRDQLQLCEYRLFTDQLAATVFMKLSAKKGERNNQVSSRRLVF